MGGSKPVKIENERYSASTRVSGHVGNSNHTRGGKVAGKAYGIKEHKSPIQQHQKNHLAKRSSQPHKDYKMQFKDKYTRSDGFKGGTSKGI